MDKRMPGDLLTPTTRGMAHETVDKQKRYRQILSVLDGCAMSAKDIAVEMCLRGWIPTDERNFTAPRLTELSKQGIVEVIGKKKCEYTGKTVAVYAKVEK